MATGAFAASAQAAAPAWMPIAASGPTNLPPVQSEIQRVAVDAEGGGFTLTAHHVGGRGMGKFAFGDFTTISGFQISSGAFSVGQIVEGEGIQPGTTITAVGANTLSLSKEKKQELNFGDTIEVLAVDASATTPIIPFDDAEASDVAAALNALSTIGGGGGSVTVKGGPGDKGATSPYFVTYGGSLANLNQPQLEAGSSELLGGESQRATVTTTLNGGPGTTDILIYAQNIGGTPSSGSEEAELSFSLPPGVKTIATPNSSPHPSSGGLPWDCVPTGAGQENGTCTLTEVVPPGVTLIPLEVSVRAEPGAASGIVHVEVEGGGAGKAVYDMPLVVSAIPAPPGIQSFNAGAFKDDGTIDARAGAHPYSASTGILINTVRAPRGKVIPAGDFRDILVDTPPGFLGNPIATPQCPEEIEHLDCKQDSIVATAQVPLAREFGGENYGEKSTVNNIEAPFGYPAKFRFITGVKNIIVNVVGAVRSDEDYGLKIGSYNTPQIKPVMGAFFTFWGTPADEQHDELRCKGITYDPLAGTLPPYACLSTADILAAGGKETAFLSNPVDCSEEAIRPPVVTINVNTWQDPSLWVLGSVPLPPVTGCENLEFKADFTFEPSGTKSDSPASFRTELAIPSEGLTNPDKLMTPTIRESVVDLPKGVVLNASAADGLGACSKEQIGLRGTNFPRPNQIRFTNQPNTCPDNSRIGSGELKTEFIEEPLKGALYLAAQGDGNPFGSLFALYLVIEDPRHGIFIKLPAEVQVNEADGQQRIVFRDLPPLPFTYLRLNLKGGDRSPLASPTTCGNFVTTATNTPWSAPESGPPTTSANGFTINQGPNGQPCAGTPGQRPFDIGWSAGSESTKSGASGPFHMRITRPDGSQELSSLDLTTPKGVSASLKGVPYCSGDQIAQAERRTGKEELAGSSCPAASKVGTLTTGAGSGSSPYYVSGNLYLAGPYKGAPISVVAITPAVAGPFDLGNVVVRAAVNINRTTAQVTAKSDSIPQFLKGVALRIKDVRIKLDRQDWTINPTNCEASSVNLKASGNSGATAERSIRFQVGGCKDMRFGPKLKAHLTGGTRRGAHPAFTATVDFPAGQANTRDVQVTLPHSEFLDQAHINTICTRVQAAANACPKGSIYGFAEATTPLIDGKLTGPVFLKSSSHQLPDLAIALRGPDSQPVEVEFQGRIDSIKAQIRNTIEGLPDVPVSKFTLKMKGGKKGLLVNSRNLCAGKVTKMTVKMVGQNNAKVESRPPLTRKCKGKATGKAKAKKAAKRGRLAGLGGAW